jgi:5'-3' exonuclease
MLLLIDGDILAFKSCKPRWQKKAKMLGNVSFVSLDDEGDKVPLEYTKEEDTQYLRESWSEFQSSLERLMDQFYTKDFLMAVKGDNNFRNTIYDQYKAHRVSDAAAPLTTTFVPAIRTLAVNEELAIRAHGRETDDYIRIWAEEARAAGEPFVVCSVDKDLKCIEGKHWLIHHKKMVEMDKLEAMKFYYGQLIMGDTTDNIPGIPGMGPVAAKKLLIDCITEEDCQEAVVSAYISAFEDDWAEFLLSNGKMIHLQRHIDDYFTLRDWPIAQELRA